MNQQQYTCACCEETISGERVEVVSDNYCTDCFKLGIVPKFEAALSEANYPVIYHHSELSIHLYTRFFSADFLRDYEAKEKEFKTPIADRLYCGAPACAAFLGPKFNHRSNTPCHACGGFTCVQCAHSITDDSHQCVQETTDRFEGLSRGIDYQICPNCNAPIQLQDGCNHVTCSMCREEFCFLCGKPAKENSGHWNFGSRCPRFGQPGPNAVFTDDGEMDLEIGPEVAFGRDPDPTMREDILLRSLANPAIGMPAAESRDLYRMVIDALIRDGREWVAAEARRDTVWPAEAALIKRDRRTTFRAAEQLRELFLASDPANPDVGLQSITLLAVSLIFEVDLYRETREDEEEIDLRRSWYGLISHYAELARQHGAFLRNPELLDVYQRYLGYYDMRIGDLAIPLDIIHPQHHQHDVDRTRARLQGLINEPVAAIEMTGFLMEALLPGIAVHHLRLGRRRIDEANAETFSSAPSWDVIQRNADRQLLLLYTERLFDLFPNARDRESRRRVVDLALLSAFLMSSVEVYTVNSIRDDDERARRVATIRRYHATIQTLGGTLQLTDGFHENETLHRIYVRYIVKYDEHIAPRFAVNAVQVALPEDAPRDTSEDVPDDILDLMVEALMESEDNGVLVHSLVRLERDLTDEAMQRPPISLGVAETRRRLEEA